MLDLFNVLACSPSATACEGVIGAGIPGLVVNIVHYVYLAIQIVVPVMLIIFGMIDLAKALSASKEDEIKKAQNGLFKKAIIAIIVFLVFSIVKFVFNFATGNQAKTDGTVEANIWTCVESLIDGKCGD